LALFYILLLFSCFKVVINLSRQNNFLQARDGQQTPARIYTFEDLKWDYPLNAYCSYSYKGRCMRNLFEAGEFSALAENYNRLSKDKFNIKNI